MLSGFTNLRATAEGASGGISGALSNIKFGDVAGGLKKSLTEGDFSKVGSQIGGTLTSALSSQFGALGGAAAQLGTALGPIGVAGLAAAAGVVAIGSAISSTVQAAAAFQTSMAGAKKVISVDDSQADAYFKQLSADLMEISTKSPVAATDLAALAAVGGSLGVESSNISGFAEAAAQMSVAFEMPAEAAATSAAKILTAFGQPIDTAHMQALGNTINQIGDSMAATESEVMDFTNRASFLNTTMGLSVTQVATLGGTLISAGLTAETASSGMKSAINTLTSTSSKTGGMDNWAKLMGVSVDELKGKVAADLPNTLVETANKIADIEDPVLRFQTAVGLAGSEGAPALLKLAGAQDRYNSSLADSISQWDTGIGGGKGGMAKTFETNSATFDSQMQILSNSMNFASVAVGNVFLPAFTMAASGISSFIVTTTQAGMTIASLVTNSQAAAALGSIFSNVGSVVGAVFTNISNVVKPAWDAIGGGTGAISGLQAAFDLLTAPLTLTWSAVSSLVAGFSELVSAASPVSSAIGEGLADAIGAAGDAITTGQAYVQAFIEVLGEIAGNSSAVQALSGAFEAVKSAVSGIANIAGKIVDGLAKAIPTAASGFVTAIASLFSQAGTAASDAFAGVIKDSPLGPVLGVLGDVSDRAAEIVQTGKDAAAAAAAGINSSEELDAARSKAADFNDPENLAAAKAAGIDVGDTAGEGMKDAFAEQVKSLVDSGVSKELAAVMTGFGTTDINALNIINKQSSETGDYGGLFGRGSGARVVKESGIEYSIKYSANSRGTDVSLYIDGQLMASGSNFGTQENAIRSLFAQANAKEKLTEKMILTFENRQGEAALIEENADAKLNLNVDWGQIEMAPATDIAKKINWSDYESITIQPTTIALGSTEWLKNILEKYVNLSGEEGEKAATEFVEDFANALASPSMDMLGSVISQYQDIRSTLSDPFDIASLDTQMDYYKTRLVSQIADAGKFCEAESKRIGSDTSAAFADGYLSEAERKKITDLIPELELLQKESPAEFAKAGLASKLAFAKEAAMDDKSAADLLESYSGLAEEVATSFAKAMNSDFATIEFDWNKIWAGDFSSTVNSLPDFSKNMFQPELINLSKDALDRYNTGLGEYQDQALQTIDAIEILADRQSWLFTDEDLAALEKYKKGEMDVKTLLEELADVTKDAKQETHQYNKAIEETDACCGQLLSDFGAWQEKNKYLWNSDYVGPSFGKEYDDALIAKASYYVIQSESAQRYTDATKGIINAKSDEYAIAEKLLTKAKEGTLTQEDYNLAVQTFGLNLTTTAGQADRAVTTYNELANAVATFNNQTEAKVDVDRTIKFHKEGDPVQEDITATVTLDTTQALSTFDAFRSQIQGKTITAKLDLNSIGAKVNITTNNSQVQAQTRFMQNIAQSTMQTNLNIASWGRNIWSADLAGFQQVQKSTGEAAQSICSELKTEAGALAANIQSAAAQIVAAIELSAGGGSGGGGLGGGSGGSGDNSFSGNFGKGYWTEWWSGSDGGYYYTDGGYADKATFAIVGDSEGGEYMVPAKKLDSFLAAMISKKSTTGHRSSLEFDLDESHMLEQASAVLKELVLTIPAKVKLDVDSTEAQEVFEEVLKRVFARAKKS